MNHSSSSCLRLFPKRHVSYLFSSTRVGIGNDHGQRSVGGTLFSPNRDGAHHRSIYNKAMKNLRLDDHANQISSSNDGKREFHTQNLSEKVNQNHKKNPWHQTKKFSLIQPRNTNVRSDLESVDAIGESCCKRLESGMVLLKNHISLSDQVEIVNICEEFGVGPGGFYQPCLSNGAKLRLQMMCFGRNWDPQTKYNSRVRSDGSEAPPLPDKLISLSETALMNASLNSKDDEIPSMYPDICIVNFYTTTGRLGLHQDRDESSFSLKRGLPVVSISIGDAAEFLYGETRDVEAASKVLLESGDVLVFGGKSRHVFHGVNKIIPDSAPLPLLKQTMLRPGRLNLTFREF